MWTQQAEDRVLQSLLVKLFSKALLFSFYYRYFSQANSGLLVSLTHTHTQTYRYEQIERKSLLFGAVRLQISARARHVCSCSGDGEQV